MRKYFVRCTLGLTCLCLGIWALDAFLANHLSVTNKSGQALPELSVTVGGETHIFTHIPVGGAVSARFRIKGDDHFTIRGKIEDGTPFSAECGYVTSGMHGQQVEIVVLPGGKVEFTQRSR